MHPLELPDIKPCCQHRALGVESPTLNELRGMSDPNALAVWDATAGLVHWRHESEERLRIAWSAHHIEPNAARASLPFDESGIGGIDLARALVALHPDVFPTLKLESATEMWRGRVGDQRVGRLSYTWGRRWAYLGLSSIGIAELVRSIPGRALRALARLDGRYKEALVTEDEALNHLIDSLSMAGRCGGDVPPAYLLRTSVAGLEFAGPGHVLIGPPSSGRRSYLERLKTLHPKKGINIDNFHGGGIPNPKYRARPGCSYAALGPGLVCIWTHAHRLEPALVRYAVEMANDPEADFRLILSATPSEWATILEMAPQAATLQKVQFNAFSEEELVMIWLCQRPMLEDRLGKILDLQWLIARLGHLRRYGDPVSILGSFLPRRNAAGVLEVNEEDYRGVTVPLCTRPLSRIGYERVIRKVGEWLLPLLPTPEHFRHAVTMDEAMTGGPLCERE